MGARSGHVLLLGAALVACASPFEAREAREEPLPPANETPAPQPPELRFETDGRFVRAAHPLPAGGLVLVLERPRSLRDASLDPDRELAWVAREGTLLATFRAPTGRAILDVTVHPSGEATTLLASEAGFALVRHDAMGRSLGTTALDDPAIARDPPALRPGEPAGPIETATHDVGRIAADGANVVLATRTGRHSVVAYRVAFDANDARFSIGARTLVVPAHPILPVGLTGGTYDSFGQLEAHYAVHVARGSSGIAYVAVAHARVDTQPMLRAHRAVFGEDLVTDPDGLDLFVTRITAEGTRLGTSVVGTPDDDQLYGLRALGDDVVALGRSERWNDAGTGFDALVGRVDARGAVAVQRFDVDRGDVAFDATPAPDGGLVVVGASGYAQNPHGASITEASDAFARWLRADGSVVALTVPRGPRHNEARTIVRVADGRIAIGGMRDGPGTHSADDDPSALRARGFATSIDP